MPKPTLPPPPSTEDLYSKPYYIEGVLAKGAYDRIEVGEQGDYEEQQFGAEMGDSSFGRYNLKNGGHLSSIRLTPPEDMSIMTEGEEDRHILVAQITLEGQTSFSFPGSEEFILTPTQGRIFRYIGGQATYQLEGGKPLHSFGVALYTDVFARYLDNNIPDVLKPFVDDDVTEMVSASFPVSQAMHSLIVAGLNAGMNGALQHIHMEGLALQFFALLTNALCQDQKPLLAKLSSKDSEAAQTVYNNLVATLNKPPSLSEFAASVGLSERRLNDAFKEIYGGTVFEVMRNLRLEEARKLLEMNDIAIKEVAWSVGYQHVTNFTNAFSDKFGESPAKYAKVHRK